MSTTLCPTDHFTTEQLTIIAEMIVHAPSGVMAPEAKQKRPKDFHCAKDYRQLIIDNAQDLSDHFGADEFDISELRGWIKRRLAFKPGDLELSGSGTRSPQIRWESQTGNLMLPGAWPSSQGFYYPFVKVRHRVYKLGDDFLELTFRMKYARSSSNP